MPTVEELTTVLSLDGSRQAKTLTGFVDGVLVKQRVETMALSRGKPRPGFVRIAAHGHMLVALDDSLSPYIELGADDVLELSLEGVAPVGVLYGVSTQLDLGVSADFRLEP